MNVQDVRFVVTDLETTGGNPDRDRIIEVGAVAWRAGVVEDRFQSLVNPRCAVPGRITRLTGLTTAEVFRAPEQDTVLDDFEAFLGDAVIVAHNAKFDVGFLNNARVGLIKPDRVLCTLKLARRLLTAPSSKGLAALCTHFGIPLVRHHRALGDAEATAHVLHHLVRIYQYRLDDEALSGLLALQNRPYAAGRRTPAQFQHLRENVLPSLPDVPGVYTMLSASGKVLYVGKAKRLTQRVRSYFSGIENHASHIRKLVPQIADIRWVETQTELESLILESATIKRQHPTYNRAQTKYRTGAYLRLNPAEHAPRWTITRALWDDGAAYVGPFGSRQDIETIHLVIERFYRLRKCDDDSFVQPEGCLYRKMGQCVCPPAPPNKRTKPPSIPSAPADHEAYSQELARVDAFLRGEDLAIHDRVAMGMREAADRRDFEEAGQFRDLLRVLTRYQDEGRQLALRVMHPLRVVANDSEVHMLIKGRRHASFNWPIESDAWEAAWEDLSDEEVDHRLLREELDEIRIVAQWLYAQREDLRVIDGEPGESLASFRARVEGAVLAWAPTRDGAGVDEAGGAKPDA